MNTDSASSMSMDMLPWLHFGNADYLIFKAWRPSSRGAIVGACIGLLFFSILDRCLAAYRRTQELRWRAKTILVSNEMQVASDKGDSAEELREHPIPVGKRHGLRFIFLQDIPRGLILAIQSTFSYALMLAVMTFNGAYIISIIVGLGVGEALVGRLGRK